MTRHSLTLGLAFISPWLVGFLAFLVYPLIASLYYSFCDYSVLEPPVFIGVDNYTDLVQDKIFWVSLGNTLLFACFSLGLGLVLSLTLAVLLNLRIPGQAIHRTIFFLPSLIPVVALSVLWIWIFNADSDRGLLNLVLEAVINGCRRFLGLAPTFSGPNWLGSETWAMPALVLMSLWGVGHPVVIYLAGLQDIPQSLYEAAELDGASAWQRLRHVTLPMLSPVIYFNLIMGIIGAFQVFTAPFMMTRGGPGRSTLFYAMALYNRAFEDLRMGYACAMAWILFLIILALTLLATRISRRWVQYDR
ncbi:MAG: sugar ABC transporter permease [Planctomycetes bacterium]|nr:sugar ABC transporter permease [Planctomycetota bacterium]